MNLGMLKPPVCKIRAFPVVILFFIMAVPTVGSALQAHPEADLPAIPLPERPRPDFHRDLWLNLNGEWKFRPDPSDRGLTEEWFHTGTRFTETIRVPFSWGSPLSGVQDTADIGWYSRMLKVPANWAGRRIFLVVGACDWQTIAWIDGERIGENRGGYTPFEFEVTRYLTGNSDHRLTLRVDDSHHPFKLEGKQGYGPARGIWQTVYLEARGSHPLKTLHFFPDIDRERIRIRAALLDPVPAGSELEVLISAEDSGPSITVHCPAQPDSRDIECEAEIPGPRLWELNDPHLYQVTATLNGPGMIEDRVKSYFGMRKISVVPIPGGNHPYIALNNRPVYLQMTLDQAYHPEGYYTFPSDDFMREEILRSKRIGLNGMRIHVKIGIPRKLYWADRLGMLIMADVPNSWSEPDEAMQREAETALFGMLERDFNHPSIFAWVLFNETWGLETKGRGYEKSTQEWVSRLYRRVREQDPTRLVEDNSANRKDHVVTDINSWHAYLPGYAWKETLDRISSQTFPGSSWNFVEGRSQAGQPNFNSECGNVWGYAGSTGDVDWSWDYHLMMNQFRKHPKICGWLYTEHHDVINEWNGYYRYDRSRKYTGMEELAEGMTLRDLHSPIYLVPGDNQLVQEASPGSRQEIPLWLSVTGSDLPRHLALEIRLHGWNDLGEYRETDIAEFDVKVRPWMSEAIDPVTLVLPDEPGLWIVTFALHDGLGTVLHRNFTGFLTLPTSNRELETRETGKGELQLVRFSPGSFIDSKWSLKQWEILGSKKVNGAGSGFFEYRLPWPEGLNPSSVAGAALVFEASAKVLLAKDQPRKSGVDGDYMRGKGAHDPGLNPNAYPMTDEYQSPSSLQVSVNGFRSPFIPLPDDPADHRGILSWHFQEKDRKLREAGSYGYLIRTALTDEMLQAAARRREFCIRFEVPRGDPGGLAIYGRQFGRYPLDPTLVFKLK